MLSKEQYKIIEEQLAFAKPKNTKIVCMPYKDI